MEELPAVTAAMNEYYHRIIPLGGDCSVAGSLRKIGYKETTYCFDWTVTKLNFILNCFNSEFKIFENLFEKCEKCGKGNLKYNDSVYFYHDDKKVSETLKQKYIKRSIKLKNFLDKTKEKILFIRKGKNDTIEDVKKLKEAIINNYPNLEFKILLLNNIKHNKYLDEHIIHKYYDKDCFLAYDKKRDSYKHQNQKKSYECVYNELQKIKSKKFIQPPHRDMDS